MTASTPSLGVLRVRDALFQWGSRTYVMGIINMTPDSFSGDGLAVDAEAAAALAKRFVEEGVDILDIGGESTRPGHTPIEAEEELKRVIPAVRAVREALPAVPISIDSFKSSVAAAALDAGADIINDQWGMQRDPDLGKLAATRGVPIILMHNQTGTNYADLMEDMVRSLEESCQRALAASVPAAHVIVDPGIGFGKSWEQNLVILQHLSALKRTGRPILLGTSRKSVIGRVLDLPMEERVEGTSATVALGIAQGADIVRVHDVKAMVRVARMADAIVRGLPGAPTTG